MWGFSLPQQLRFLLTYPIYLHGTLKSHLVSHDAPLSDPGNPSTVFVTPYFLPTPEEDTDFLFRCLLTDPSVTNLTLQSADRGKDLPPGMKVTLDPRSGALIKHVKTSFKGRYTCSGWRNGQEFRSQPLDLMVAFSKTHVSWFTCLCTQLTLI